MAFTNPTISQFQNMFQRDFSYGTDPNTSVVNADIQTAQNMVNLNINPALFANQTNYSLGYNLLTAHYLVLNLRTSSQGLSGQYNFLQNSKGVGGASESFAIPERIMDNPYWAMLTKTNYGARYLELLLPQLTGQVFVAYGTTQP